MTDSDNDTKIRLDKWLWAARFFKTRAFAAEAVNGGKVHLNGARVKPSRALKEGDQLAITKGAYTLEVTVRRLSVKRGAAKVAAELFEESEESRTRREALSEERKLQRAGEPAPERRPDKRERRQIVRFRDGG